MIVRELSKNIIRPFINLTIFQMILPNLFYMLFIVMYGSDFDQMKWLFKLQIQLGRVWQWDAHRVNYQLFIKHFFVVCPTTY